MEMNDLTDPLGPPLKLEPGQNSHLANMGWEWGLGDSQRELGSLLPEGGNFAG